MSYTQEALRALPRKTWIHLAITFTLLLLPVYGFIELADEVRDSETLIFDESILRSVHNASSPLTDALVVGFTQLGGVIGVAVLTVGAVALLWVRGLHNKAFTLLAGVGGGLVLNLFLKAIFQRDRPQLWDRLVTENSFSFPSGHAMASSALACSLIVIFWPTRWRWPVLVSAILYMVMIGFTRLYLGVHYPTDVLAGWLVSVSWVVLVAVIVSYRARLSGLVSRVITRVSR